MGQTRSLQVSFFHRYSRSFEYIKKDISNKFMPLFEVRKLLTTNYKLSKCIMAPFLRQFRHTSSIGEKAYESLYIEKIKSIFLRCWMQNFQYQFLVTMGMVVSFTKTNSTQLMNTLIIMVSVSFLASTNTKKNIMFQKITPKSYFS